VVPRKVSGGSSLRRYFVTGQLNPQPTEVMARNIRPAGAIRAGAVGFDSVMEPGKAKGWGGKAMESARTLPPIHGCDHGGADMPDLPIRNLT
jgi:hypothetical protein